MGRKRRKQLDLHLCFPVYSAAMTALNGALEEWQQAEDQCWFRPGHPEDGRIRLKEGLTFKDYYVRRATTPEPKSVLDMQAEKIVELEQRLAKLEPLVEQINVRNPK